MQPSHNSKNSFQIEEDFGQLWIMLLSILGQVSLLGEVLIHTKIVLPVVIYLQIQQHIHDVIPLIL